MKGEQYNIVFKGQLEPGFEKSVVVDHLTQLFNIEQVKAAHLIDNDKPRVIIRKLPWNKMIRYRKKMKEIGMSVYADVVLDSNIFRESIVPKVNTTIACNETEAKKEETPENENSELQVLRFDTTRLIPAIFATPHSEKLIDAQENQKYTIESYNHSINRIVLILLSLLTAIVVQNYFGLLFVHYLPSALVTPLLITLFFLIAIFLPKILAPKRLFAIKNAKDGGNLLVCVQESNLNPIVDKYNIFSKDDVLIAKVIYSRMTKKIICRDEENNVLFSSYEEKRTDETIQDMATEISDGLYVIFEYLDYATIFLRRVKKIFQGRKNKPSIYQRSDMT